MGEAEPPAVMDLSSRFAFARNASVDLLGSAVKVPGVIVLEPEGTAGGCRAVDLDGRDHSVPVGEIAEMLDASVVYPPSLPELCEPVRRGRVMLLPVTRAPPLPRQGDLVVVPHLGQVSDPVLFVEFMMGVRRVYDAVVYAPGCALPWRVAFYAYFGVDIVDTAGVLPRPGEALTVDGPLPLEMDLRTALGNEVALARHTVASGGLRELVERRVTVEPWMMAALRYSDLFMYPRMEYHYPVGSRVNAASREALERPDVRRFRERVLSRYERPPYARVLLLLPCSAKKPYADSRTHRRINDVLRSVPGGGCVHRVVVTSPLGLVPEEIDIVPPASSYDIPVIGVWDENERRVIADSLEAYLERNRYEHVVNHASDDIPALTSLSDTTTLKGHPLSEASLEGLRRTLAPLLEDAPSPGRRERRVWRYNAIARFQFGTSLGIDEVRHHLQRDMLLSRGEVMAHASRSAIVLEPGGGRSLLASKRHCVGIGDFELRGDIFAPGVVTTSGDFRVGDQVVVHHEGEVRALGTAVMTPAEMVEMGRGLAVRVRVRIHAHPG